jgi:hypothetical protein
VLLHVLREDREDVELIRGALETLVSALTPIETSHRPKNEAQPAPMNSDLLSRESVNISLLLSLLVSFTYDVCSISCTSMCCTSMYTLENSDVNLAWNT